MRLGRPIRCAYVCGCQRTDTHVDDAALQPHGDGLAGRHHACLIDQLRLHLPRRALLHASRNHHPHALSQQTPRA
jgi:hypothetical protein